MRISKAWAKNDALQKLDKQIFSSDGNGSLLFGWIAIQALVTSFWVRPMEGIALGLFPVATIIGGVSGPAPKSISWCLAILPSHWSHPHASLLAVLVSLVTALAALVAWPTDSFVLNDEAPMKMDLKVLSGIAMQPVVEDLGPKFERATGHKLVVTFANLGGAVKRVQDGETADVLIIPRSGIEGFVKDGRVAAGNVTVIAHSSMGVAVRKGAPKPDISSPEAFKRALLAAKSITYANPATGAASGQYFVTMLDRMGIANEMKPKTVLLSKPGQSPLLVANGEVELVMNQIQELIPVSGIEVVGPFPRDLQMNIVFSAAIMTGVKYPEVSRELIEFLRTPEAVAVIRTKGMEPGAP